MSSGISFARNLHIRIKNGVTSAPFGYASVLKFGIPVIPPRTPGKIEVIESPILKYAQEFADSHREIGYLTDNRLSQDAYNYASLKLSYMKKGLSESQANTQAKKDVIKNLEVRSLELDLIQNQALKIGIPSFQPKSHLEQINTLTKKVEDRRAEYEIIEAREKLEGTLALKFQYGDMTPLTLSNVSLLSPIQYFIFVKEHPEYHKVLLQPIGEDQGKVNLEEINSSGGRFTAYDYSMNPKNSFFLTFSKSGKSYMDLVTMGNDMVLEKGVKRKVAKKESTKDEDDDEDGVDDDEETTITESEETEDVEYEAAEKARAQYTMRLSAKLKENDFSFTLTDLEKIPNSIDRTQLVQDKLKKNFFSVESLSQSKIDVEQGRFISKDNGFPSAANIPLDSFSRLPTVSSIKTLRHLLSIGDVSKELYEYLERQESGGGAKIDESVIGGGSDKNGNSSLSADSNIGKNYLFSDLSHIETLSNLKRYNDIPVNDGLNSVETDLKETYVNTVLNVTDKLYTAPIKEQRILKEKFSNEFTFEESLSIDDLNSPIDEFAEDLITQSPPKGPIIEEDGLIDLKNTNIFSSQPLYESFITNKYQSNTKEEEEEEEEQKQQQLKEKKEDEEYQKPNFQNILSDEALNIASGKSTMDPLYLLDANNNRSTLLYQNSTKKQQQQPSSSSVNSQTEQEIESNPTTTLFDKFFEKYILPENIVSYSKYHAKRIIQDENRIKSQLNQELLLKQQQEQQHNQNSINKDQTLILDGPTYERLSILKLNHKETTDLQIKTDIEMEIVEILESLTNQSLTARKNAHNHLYPEYKNASKSIINEKKISEDLIRYVIDSDLISHKYNVAPSIDKEDKVDFRTLKLDPETEHQYAHHIKEFRDKDAKGLISQQDAFEFTNYINYLKESSATSPIIQSLKSSIHMKSNNNELIDQFNAESLEKDTTTTDKLSPEGLFFKQLGEMFPSEADKEIAINTLLYQNNKNQKIQKLENDLVNAISKDSTIRIPSPKELNQSLADAKVEFSKKTLTSKDQFDFDN
ncbi:hypothetical protein DDB_G0291175 [Dictyostelium discoideum AX4]|uniref:Uncharacterized protein n=1 Tax=Dictyostelium discoideum TaxID=44689 RepID=Q54F09_DICDI|nr:hypothetical protein DDB_G0291175 [Dictyostelium discoideum AX4]EAL61871.1 hypothetical protein DDB_G0291175 [Dictyostelium discoideum AX4]|eukprot:XP_635381.1 hypothetical protein DDB_G0291175 [Dictyostelium discoideum AX4]